jgi:protein TonB
MPDAKRQTRNGASHAPRFAMSDGAAAAYDDPMSKVLGLDAQTDSPTAWLIYTLGAIALFLGLMVSARVVAVLLARMDTQPLAAPSAPQEIEVEEPPPPPLPPPAPEETAQPEPAPPVVKATPHEPPPAAAPAQAAKVLAQEPDPNEPVDLTGNTIVQGNADTYAGGTTAANGTSNRAVRNVATSPTGLPGGTGAPQAAPSGPDRSQKCSVGGTDWNAPFPPEADTAQIDEAYVTLQIDVKPDGTASAVRVMSDPGNGFGREAKRYALGRHYPPQLDHEGNPSPGLCTVSTRVHFSR